MNGPNAAAAAGGAAAAGPSILLGLLLPWFHLLLDALLLCGLTKESRKTVNQLTSYSMSGTDRTQKYQTKASLLPLPLYADRNPARVIQTSFVTSQPQREN